MPSYIRAERQREGETGRRRVKQVVGFKPPANPAVPTKAREDKEVGCRVWGHALSPLPFPTTPGAPHARCSDFASLVQAD